ncbi:MAG: dihydroorotate dehydrogenase, partial [Thermoprotei archaeon]
ELAQLAEEHGANAVELNLSCPHVAKRGLEIGQDPQYVSKIVNSVKSTLNIPVLVKIGLSDRLVEIAEVIEKSGADAISAINTIRAIVIDVYAKRPVLSNIYGGLSGPAIHPIAVRVVYDLYKTVSIPIVGIGGVMDWKDAIELILAGATAIGVGSAIVLKDIGVFREILRGMEEYLKEEGIKSIREIIGYAHKA